MLSKISLAFALMTALSDAQNFSVAPSQALADQIQEILWIAGSRLNATVFVYESSANVWEPSDVYTLPDFARGVEAMYEDGVAGKYFYIGDESEQGYKYGVANMAAFLAQVMKETLRYNACDENSYELVGGVYPVSNSCGQLSQSYQDYTCPEDQKFMQCPVDPDMTINASTNALWFGAPGPLYCGPTTLYPTTGFWDYEYLCNSSCTVYEGQKAGREVTTTVTPNAAGRTDVEGCCWWGRGAIQTSGPCNYGRMNYFLAKGAADAGLPSRYPTLDICSNPGAICSSEEFPELKWVAGLFYWVDSIQTYSSSGWDYLTELHKFVDGGMVDSAFIDSVSGIVNRGCHNPPCASGSVDGGPERASHFLKVLAALEVEPTSRPPSTPAPVAAAPVAAPTGSEPSPSSGGGSESESPSSSRPTTLQPTAETAAPTEIVEMCCAPEETSQKPIRGCSSFYFCFNGTLVDQKPSSCREGLLFDYALSACNDAEKVKCIDSACQDGKVVDTGLVKDEDAAKDSAGVTPTPRYVLTSIWSVFVLTLIRLRERS